MRIYGVRLSMGRGTLVGSALLLAAFACSAPIDANLEVSWAGCAQVLVGPQCLVDPKTPIVFVVAGTSQDLRVETDLGQVETSSVVVLPGGVRISVQPPVDARTLTVGRGAASFTLAVAPFTRHPEIKVARTLRNDPTALRAHLAQVQAGLPASAQAEAAGLLARARLKEGAYAEAAVALQACAEQAWVAGLASNALADLFAASWVLTVKTRDFAQARTVLRRAERWSAQVPSERAAVLHYRAQLDLETFDLRSAQAGFAQALDWARRHDDSRRAAAAEEMHAVVAVELGHAAEAVPVFERLVALAPTACARANSANNLGWARTMTGALDGAKASLELAARLYKQRCPDPTGATYAHLNRALVALDARDLKAASEALAAAGEDFDARTWLWAEEIRGRLAAAEGRTKAARRAFARLRDRAELVGARDAAWRARVGLARQYRTHSATTAIALLVEAERDLDALTRGAPATDGLSRFLARHDDSARLLVALYLEQGQVEAAHQVATRALHRPLLTLLGLGRIARLNPEARAEWDRRIGRYATLREQALQAALTIWQVPHSEAAAAAAAAESRAAALQTALEDALQALPKVPSLAVSSPRPGEALVTVFSLGSSHALFVRTSSGTEGRIVPAGQLASALERVPGQRWAIDAAESLKLPASVRAVQVLHLGAIAPQPARAALVVGDPTGDLAGSRAEARVVADRLRAQGLNVTLLLGEQANLHAVLAALPKVQLFHYAGHARHEGPDGWNSALPLADMPLRTSDLLALARAPAQVVLSGCEAGRVASTEAHTLGLAHAFLLAGSREVVAPRVAVPDDMTLDLMTVLYEALAKGRDPEAVLRRIGADGPAPLRGLARSFRVFQRR